MIWLNNLRSRLSENDFSLWGILATLFPIDFIFQGHLNGRLLGHCVFTNHWEKCPQIFHASIVSKDFPRDINGMKTGRNPATIESIHAADRPSETLIRSHQKSISWKTVWHLVSGASILHIPRNCRPARTAFFFFFLSRKPKQPEQFLILCENMWMHSWQQIRPALAVSGLFSLCLFDDDQSAMLRNNFPNFQTLFPRWFN